MACCFLLCSGLPVASFFLIGERFPQNFRFGNNWRYESIYGGVLSLFMNFSRSKNIKFVNIPIFGKKRKIWKIEKLREKNVEILEKKQSSPIRMTPSPFSVYNLWYYCNFCLFLYCLPHLLGAATLSFFFPLGSLCSFVSLDHLSTSYENIYVVPVVSSTITCLHIEPFFLQVDIQHNQCPCRFFDHRDTSSVVTKLRHRDTTWYIGGILCFHLIPGTWYRITKCRISGVVLVSTALVSSVGMKNR